MNYQKFKAEWLRLMQVKHFYDKVYLEQDINDAYTYFKTDPMKHRTPKKWIEFFYVDYTEEKHPYRLKTKNELRVLRLLAAAPLTACR